MTQSPPEDLVAQKTGLTCGTRPRTHELEAFHLSGPRCDYDPFFGQRAQTGLQLRPLPWTVETADSPPACWS
ncbi:hypothetical protein BST61_g8236 [Cercospora zeina]